jgi:O-antigen ligase
MWALGMLLSLARGPLPTGEALVVGLMIGLLAVKPADWACATRVGTILGWTVIVVVVVTVALESRGVVDSWYHLHATPEVQAFERSNYWLPLADPLGLDGRWAGPFIHPNRAGPVGAFLLVFGVTLRGVQSWVFAAVGFLVLALSASRTAELAALLGVATVLVAVKAMRGRQPTRGSVGACAVALVGLVVVLGAPLMLPVGMVTESGPPGALGSALTGSGRTGIWPTYIHLWLTDPWLGVGTRRINTAVASGELPAWAAHAHNTILDATTRYGVLALVLVLGIFAVLLFLGYRAARVDRPASLGLAVMLVVAGMGHTVVGFRYPEVSLPVLLLAVMMSAPDEKVRDDE